MIPEADTREVRQAPFEAGEGMEDQWKKEVEI